ncbi:hypothetical protein OS493_013675 [Desmophyllum pertusum]|uniref:Uncharacterized protein n=1 Tax=Desmophyllum pertusum TaxID=174260 RepID=A0A9X0D5J4_9CNID|nr:hypothetical protein OS493_013675 [Desmophyllum pertusum]
MKMAFPSTLIRQLPTMDPLSPETQCQFILKRNRKIPNRIAIDVHNAPSKQRWKNPIKKSPIINWAMHKKTTGSTKANSIDGQSSTPGKLFGLPLMQLCSEEEPVPKSVQELLLHLFRYGPIPRESSESLLMLGLPKKSSWNWMKVE